MESLNMNTLANSLPNSVNAEKQLMDNFKAAALSITTLYRSSLDTSKRAYSVGYATCLRDVLQFVEAGVSVSGNEGEEMTIGRVMDWLEARLEAIKSTDEEEEEERLKDLTAKPTQEDERERDNKKVCRTIGSGNAPHTSRLHRRSKENLRDTVLPIHDSRQTPSARPPSLSPTTRPRSLTSPSPPPQPVRAVKSKRGLKDLGSSIAFPTDTIAITPGANSSPFTLLSEVVSPVPMVGSKRRHAAMISESPASSSGAATSSPSQGGGYIHVHSGNRRKRGRGGRDREGHHSQNMTTAGSVVQNQGYTDAMEIEEDGGRERKRVARR